MSLLTLSPTLEARFTQWLNLNLASLAWEGKHRRAFDEFWQAVFLTGEDALVVMERLRLAQEIARTGPLRSWLKWLHDRFAIFSFAESGLSLADFCQRSQIPESWFAQVMREYFLSLVPEQYQAINELLDIGGLLSPNRSQTFASLAQRLGFTELKRHGDEEDMMLGMEVTLYPQWVAILRELKKDIQELRFDWESFKKRLSWRRGLKFLREVLLLLLVTFLLVTGLRWANFWYEDYIVKRIKLLEPTFFGLDLSLLYRPEDRAQRNIELSNEEIDKLEKIESAKSFEEIKDVRFDPESDEVVLKSVEEIPHAIAEDGPSQFEESYRDQGSGSGKIRSYRVLMTSVSPQDLRDRILPLLDKFKASPLGDSKPGTVIPGGVYFNLLVPSSQLKFFMGHVTQLGEATIFESFSREPTPAGKNRVFIWVKGI